MTAIVRRTCDSLKKPDKLFPGGDLWRYAPVRDAQGRALCDLMMLIPGLKKGQNLPIIIRHQLQDVLESFGDQVMFADLNIRLGILWISVTPEPGLCAEVADAIHARIEGARLVGNYVRRPEPKKIPWRTRVIRLLT